MHYQAFWLPKRGNSAEEYEDAFAADVETGRFAVADGATESSFAAAWARLLVEGFLRSSNPLNDFWLTQLPQLQQHWAATFQNRLLPWYARTKLAQGAFAAFVGLVIEQTPTENLWRAVAVGDSCLFHVGKQTLCQVFPVSNSRDFGNSPWLVGSHSDIATIVEQRQVQMNGNWRGQDRFCLMTDALAQWFLRQCDEDKEPWKVVDRLLAESDADPVFGAWVEELRDRQEIRNDDVTLLVVDL